MISRAIALIYVGTMALSVAGCVGESTCAGDFVSGNQACAAGCAGIEVARTERCVWHGETLTWCVDRSGVDGDAGLGGRGPRIAIIGEQEALEPFVRVKLDGPVKGAKEAEQEAAIQPAGALSLHSLAQTVPEAPILQGSGRGLAQSRLGEPERIHKESGGGAGHGRGDKVLPSP